MFFRPCPFVDWLVCQPGDTKTTERFSRKLGGQMKLSPKYNPLTFGVDPDNRMDHFILSGS